MKQARRRGRIARKTKETQVAVALELGPGPARIAPEHLELLVADPWALLPQVRNAGAVFLGAHTPEAAGDYLAGPNHVLPTAGTARFASPLSVATFRRRMSVLDLSPAALAKVAPAVEALARAEGLEGHWRAVEVRVSRAARPAKVIPLRAGAPAAKAARRAGKKLGRGRAAGKKGTR